VRSGDDLVDSRPFEVSVIDADRFAQLIEQRFAAIAHVQLLNVATSIMDPAHVQRYPNVDLDVLLIPKVEVRQLAQTMVDERPLLTCFLVILQGRTRDSPDLFRPWVFEVLIDFIGRWRQREVIEDYKLVGRQGSSWVEVESLLSFISHLLPSVISATPFEASCNAAVTSFDDAGS
jgi:hypothetical protein